MSSASDTVDSRNTFDQDGVLDIDSLKQFTIPKKNKAKADLLESVALDSHEYQRDILHLIQRSYRDRESSQLFVYNNPRLVHNSILLEAFLQKKKSLKQDGYSEKELKEIYGFVCYGSQNEARRACEPGIKVGNKPTLNCLGNPKMGVYLSRHSDVIFEDQSKQKQSGVLVIFKLIKGRVKLIKTSKGVDSREPTPNFDCHQIQVAAPSEVQHSSFQNSLIFAYEYTEELELADQPRQICPFAVVDFSYTGSAKDDIRTRTSVKALHSAKAADKVVVSSLVRAPLLPIPSTKVPRLVNSTDVSSVRTAPADSSSGSSYFLPAPSRHDNQISSRRPSDGRSVEKQSLSLNGVSEVEVEGGKDLTEVGNGVLLTSCTVENRRRKCMIWSGRIAVNETDICGGEILSSFAIDVKPWAIGSSMNLSNKITTVTVRSRYLRELSSISKNCTNRSGDFLISYARMRPTSVDFSLFTRFLVYLAKNQSAAFVEYPEQRLIVLFPDYSDFVTEYGLSGCDEPDRVFLHVFFVSLSSSVAEINQVDPEICSEQGFHLAASSSSTSTEQPSFSSPAVSEATSPDTSLPVAELPKVISDRDPRASVRGDFH